MLLNLRAQPPPKPKKFSLIEMIKSVFKNGIRDFGYNVFVWEDEENPTFTNYQMRGNFVKINAGNLGSGGNVDISADAYISKKNEIFVYGLLVKCNVKGGLNFLRKNVLLLNIDGKEMNFDLSEVYYKIDEFSNFGENYSIEQDRLLIDKDIIKLIADSLNVEFKVNGEKQTIEGYFSNKNINRFREFYYDYLQ